MKYLEDIFDEDYYDARYLLGVSGGCDSMALLDMAVKEKLNIVVCFVNYKLRKTADLEEELVMEYCKKNNVELHVYYPVQEEKDNFQKWAREARYGFYKQIYDEKKCQALLLGHQKDDHLENYLMARERGSHGWYYGIRPRSFHHDMFIIRPLLDMRKKDTRQYCLDNNVPFHDDESNFTDKYTRNRIRHNLVETASDEQIAAWIREIDEFNKKQEYKLGRFDVKYYGMDIPIADFECEEYQNDLIRWLIYQSEREGSYSDAFIEDIVKSILSSPKGHKKLENGYLLNWEYGIIYVWKPEEPFELVLNELTYGAYDSFLLSEDGRKIEGVHLRKDDFPVRVRYCREGDTIKMRYGHKKLNRFFIDRKMLTRDRQKCLVMVNKDDEVIFADGIGCDVKHYSPNFNMYLVKFVNLFD